LVVGMGLGITVGSCHQVPFLIESAMSSPAYCRTISATQSFDPVRSSACDAPPRYSLSAASAAYCLKSLERKEKSSFAFRAKLLGEFFQPCFQPE